MSSIEPQIVTKENPESRFKDQHRAGEVSPAARGFGTISHHRFAQVHKKSPFSIETSSRFRGAVMTSENSVDYSTLLEASEN
jgi:hypothetical protein